MGILEIIGIVYLSIGAIYATYILLFGHDAWYLFPINVLLGPLTIIYTAILVIKTPKRMF